MGETDSFNAFYKKCRDAIRMPFILEDTVLVVRGPLKGTIGAVIAPVQTSSGLMYTVETSSRGDHQVLASDLQLLDP